MSKPASAPDQTAWFDVAMPIELPAARPVRRGRKVAYAVAMTSLVLAACAAFGRWTTVNEPGVREAVLTMPADVAPPVHVVQPEPAADLAAVVTRNEAVANETQPAAIVPKAPVAAPVLAAPSPRKPIPRPVELGLKDPYR